jgi:hypothetical protein
MQMEMDARYPLVDTTPPQSAIWSMVLGIIGGLIALLGAATSQKEALALGTFLFGQAYFIRDYFVLRRVTPMTIYMLSGSLWFGLANLVGFLSVGTEYQAEFESWGLPRYYLRAQFMASSAVFIPAFFFGWAENLRILPKVGSEITQKGLLQVVFGFALATWAARVVGVNLDDAGTVGTLVSHGPRLVVFVMGLQWASSGYASPRFKLVIWTVLLGETIYALAFSFLRTEAIWPMLSLGFAFAICRRISRRAFVFASAAALLFLFLFTPLSDARRVTLPGSERIQMLWEDVEFNAHGLTAGSMHLLARLSTTAQLTHICRLVEERGFLEGETIAYAVYVLIPRVIWPGKPQVVPGQWFARQVGHGTERASGGFSNAINMTVPGELYLNFGWIGVFTGLMVFGTLLRMVWNATDFHAGSRNVFSHVLAFICFVQAVSVGAHVGAIFNLLLWYLLTFGLSLVLIVMRASTVPDVVEGGGRRPPRPVAR